jgi:predicted nucleic acid-binding Zn ribbon protein
MPLYDWKCSCGNEQEIFKKLNEADPIHCGEPMQKMVVSKIALKDPSGNGLGWCNDGYRVKDRDAGIRTITKKFLKGKQVI